MLRQQQVGGLEDLASGKRVHRMAKLTADFLLERLWELLSQQVGGGERPVTVAVTLL